VVGWKTRGAGNRLAPLVVALLLALGLIIAPTPHSVRAEPLPAFPTIYTEPYCISTGGAQTVTFKGRNFEPNAGLTLVQFGTFDGPPPTLQVTTDAYGVFVGDIFVSVGSYTYGIRVDAFYDTNNESTVTSAFVNGCNSGTSTELAVVTSCGDFDNPSIEVRGDRFGGPDVGGDITIELQLNEQTVGTPLTINAAESFDVTLQPGVTLQYGEYTVVANQQSSSDSGTWYGYDSFFVPCPQATIDLVCAQNAGGPPDRMSILVSGTGWQKGTADGYDELEIVFDPDGEPQEFFFSANPYESEPGIGDDGSIGPLEINPYARPNGIYRVQIKQQGYGQDPLLDVVTTFTVPCSTPTIFVDPTCGPPQLVGDEAKRYSVNVTGKDFLPNAIVTVVFDPDFAAGSDYPPENFSASADADGGFTVDIDAAYRPPGAYRIYAYQQTRSGNYQAYAPFPVPCSPPAPALTLDPTCGRDATGLPLAYTINVAGSGFVPGPVNLVFDSTGVTPEPATAVADGSGDFTFALQVNGRPPGAYIVDANQATILGPLDEVTVPFLVACEGVLLRITPTGGARGFVPLVEGFNFPPLTTLLLRWDYGIGASRPITVQTDATGIFTRQLLIFRDDFMGLRHLSVELPTDPLAYADVSVPYLVVAGTVSPPFVTDNPFGPPGPIVLRR
jgi:hypothetical protein